MMKKLSISGSLIALVLVLAVADAYGQRQQRPGRVPGGRKGIDRILGVPKANAPRPEGRLPRLTPEQRRMVRQRLIREIGLTDNQRLRMAEIQRSHEDDVISAGRRLREARQALDRAIRSEQFDERQVNQYIEDLAAAQADQVRLQARIRARMRGVLTSDQMMRLNELERRLRRQMREQQEREMKQDGARDQNAPDSMRYGDEEPFDLISFLILAR
jgi:Spy/CpxP family protein refolding chaperone